MFSTIDKSASQIFFSSFTKSLPESFDFESDTFDVPCGILSSLCSFQQASDLLFLTASFVDRLLAWARVGVDEEMPETGTGNGWTGWAFVHPDFAGIEKRTETKTGIEIYYHLPT